MKYALSEFFQIIDPSAVEKSRIQVVSDENFVKISVSIRVWSLATEYVSSSNTTKGAKSIICPSHKSHQTNIP